MQRAEIRAEIIRPDLEADKEIFLRAVRAGVVGYVPKDAHASEIAAAVRCVAAHNAVCLPGLCLALFEPVIRAHEGVASEVADATKRWGEKKCQIEPIGPSLLLSLGSTHSCTLALIP